MVQRSFITALLIFFMALQAHSQIEPEGRYKGQICFRHCVFFKLNIRDNGTFVLQSKGYRSEWKTSYGMWYLADDVITLKTIDSSTGYVDVSSYIVRKNGLWSFDKTTKELKEEVFQSRRILFNKSD